MESKIYSRHGFSRKRVYKIWQNMKSRCQNKNHHKYKIYGAIGISISQEWQVFENFLKDMGECPAGYQLDRVNPDKNYCKENCRWVNTLIQGYNKRNINRNLPRGVYISKSGRFEAKCSVEHKSYLIGTFDTPEIAKAEFDKFCIEWYGFSK